MFNNSGYIGCNHKRIEDYEYCPKCGALINNDIKSILLDLLNGVCMAIVFISIILVAFNI